MSCVFVIGTGRSGTSLAMQALEALGVTLPDDVVPASETNRRGTGESMAVRDRMSALNRALHLRNSFRPDDWRDRPVTVETLEWLVAYLAHQKTISQGRHFAVKFPLTAMFLPLWLEAAQRTKIKLDIVWATRSAMDTIGSVMRSYDRSVSQAAAVWAQRTYYLLRDAPDGTLVFPMQGWFEDTSAQMAALASRLELDTPSKADSAGVFLQGLAREADNVKGVPETVLRCIPKIDALLTKRVQPLGHVLDRSSADYLATMLSLSDAISGLIPDKIATHGETKMRNGLPDDVAEAGEKKENAMQAEIDALQKKLKDAFVENRKLSETVDELEGARRKTDELSKAYSRLSKERDALEERSENRNRYRLMIAETQLATVRARLEKLENGKKDVIIRRLRKELANTGKAIRKMRQELTDARGATRGLRRKVEQVMAERDAYLSSTSWRMTAPMRQVKILFSRRR